jgi:hypothetical protein
MEAFGIRTAGWFAKLVWAFVHIQFLVVMSSRIGTLFRWSWKLLTRQRLARLIIEPEALQGAIPATQHNGQRTNGEAEKKTRSADHAVAPKTASAEGLLAAPATDKPAGGDSLTQARR